MRQRGETEAECERGRDNNGVEGESADGRNELASEAAPSSRCPGRIDRHAVVVIVLAVAALLFLLTVAERIVPLLLPFREASVVVRSLNVVQDKPALTPISKLYFWWLRAGGL